MMFYTFSRSTRTAPHRGARRAGVLAIAALIVVVAVALVVVGCPDDTTDTPGGSTAKYTCENGTAKTGAPSGTADVEECIACNSGFTLNAEKTCVADSGDTTAPTFTDGPKLNGNPTANGATIKLTAGEAGKVFWVLYAGSDASPDTAAALIAAASGSSAGEARSGADATVDAATEKTVALSELTAGTTYNFYAVLQDNAANNGAVSTKLVVTTAATGSYTCENGTAKTGTPSGSTDVEACQNCESGYTLKGDAGVDGTTCTDQTAPTFSAQPAVKAGTLAAETVTVTLTSSEAGKLFWAIYDNDTVVASNTDLITAVTADTKPGTVVARSAVAGVDVTTAPKEIEVSGLSAKTDYNFYAVLQDSASNNGKISAVLEITTAAAADKTPPAFASGKAPAVDGTTANGATVKFTASEAGKVFWVLYAENDPSPDNAAALIAAASGSTVGVKQSGANEAVTAAEKTLTITGLTPGTTYNFYAVLQDNAANTSAVSATLEIITSTTAAYTCTNGTPLDSTPSGGNDVEECKACNPGYTLANKRCTDSTAPTFIDGPKLDGDPTATAATVKLTASEAGKLFWVLYAENDPSPDNAATLIAAASGSTVGVQQSGDGVAVDANEKTVTLSQLTPGTTYNFYAVLQDSAGNTSAVSKIDITTVATAIYTCANGTAQTGNPSGDINVEECTVCNAGYTINASKRCTDITPPTFSTAPALDGSPTATAATVKLTASEAGKLFWVLYAANAPAPANAAALIADASDDSSAGVKRSGASETVTTAEKTVMLSQLTSDTTYDFYAVLQDSAANTSAVSAKVEITTPDITPPTFSTAPALKSDSVTQTSAEITLTASEPGKLFWVLYTENAPAPANAAALIAAASGSTAGEQRSGDSVTVTTATATVTLRGLTINTNYDFYAALQDSASNTSALSAKLDIATAVAIYTCSNGDARAGNPSGTSNIESCRGCNNGFKLDGTTCVATMYTCHNGTPQSGVPDGNDDVESCTECRSGYILGSGVLKTCTRPFSRHANGVTILCPNASNGDTGVVDSVTYTKRATLSNISDSDAATTCTSGITSMRALFLNKSNFNGNISHWDTSSVTDMGLMFLEATAFNQDISSWDVSKVTDMSSMFNNAESFNGDISGWDVSKAENMNTMFLEATAFNQDLSKWDTSLVTTMERMFERATAFNGDISEWKVGAVTSVRRMFNGATAFNKDLSWDVGNVANMSGMFGDASLFNGDISKWNVSNVTNMSAMFFGASAFNGDISAWDVGNVMTMSFMFRDAAAFNQNLNWDVGNVTDMNNMFKSAAAFNGDISGWNVSKVTNTAGMFSGATLFNANISGWNVGKVTDMSSMFGSTSAFNQDLNWNVSNVDNMSGMFNEARGFNGDISGWNVGKVTSMSAMFWNATVFNQNIGGWNVSNVTRMGDMFQGATAFNQNIGSWDVSNVNSMGNMFQSATAFNQNIG